MKMYKLFVTRDTKCIFLHGVNFIPKLATMQHTMRLCSFCNFYHGEISKFAKHHQVRTITITTANILGPLSVRKKVKQRTKKYVELLSVTNGTTSNKRTEVQKLTASNLSMFVDYSDVNTDNSCGIKDSVYNRIFDSKYINDECDNGTYVNIENNPDILTQCKMKHNNKFHENHFNNLNKCKELKSDSSEKKKMSNKTLKSSMNKPQPQENMILNKSKNNYNDHNYVGYFLIHMQVYVSCGLLNKANKLLMKYRINAKKRLKCYNNESIKIYNTLLEAYAFKRNITKVLELYNIIKKDSLIPTPQTYACIFDAIGRQNSNQIVLLKELNDEMKNYNISFDDIFNKSCFKNDQQKNVLKVINMLESNFKPLLTYIKFKYECNVLNTFKMDSNYDSPAKGLFTMEKLRDLLKIQLQNESEIEVQIPSIEARDTDIKNSNLEEKIAEVENFWKNAALTAFERNVKCLKQKESHSNNPFVLYPFLEVLDKENYVNAILREVRQIAVGSETYSTSLKSLYVILGKHIYKKYEIQTKKRTGVLDKIITIYSKYLEWYLHPENMTHVSNVNNRILWQYFTQEEANYGIFLNDTCLNWPIDIIIQIGKFLYNIILNDIVLPSETLKGQDLKCSIPAFYTLFRNKGAYLSEQIKPHPSVSKLYKDHRLKTLTFDVLLLPSYIPPKPWISIHSGGYLITKADFIRIPDYNEYSWHQLQNTPPEQLSPVFDSLNQLSSIPWKINTAILDIVIKIFQDGGSEELNVPQSVSVLTPPPSVNKSTTLKEKQHAIVTMNQYKQRKYDMYSLWCDTLYKLSIANHFRNEIFWLPHNLDFRGRVYPIPPYLNHLTSDLGRSLLLFGKGKPLGPNGLDWLKIHVINLTNFKKGCSIKERLEFANQNMENILDSATKPLTGKMWWKKSEEPWQTLAGCMEIANALNSPNVEEYVGMFPIHQDGSCNGLQHYAALGRDKIGAKSVNLYSFDVPKDIYSEVASAVEKQRQTDTKKNVEIALALEGFVKRKVIKQTVMTTVYGVTKYGAKHQIAKQLRDMEGFPRERLWPASLYLTEIIFHTLRTMFQSARQIQDWFVVCARIISHTCGQNVEWITPLGFPIIQPYIKQSSHKIKTYMKPDTMKQRNAFAPNFIHSLDSTHMMLTSLHCNRENVTFISIHDCFWTHPCTVDIMNRICREQFVALHSEPILENLAKYFVYKYSPIYEQLEKPEQIKKIEKSLTAIPSKGNFDIKSVLSSVYFFN